LSRKMYVTEQFDQNVREKDMDRRQLKTRNAILGAFRVLLESKSYNNITVQDIIDEANVGRSTFYAHFETKDELLSTICSQIFEHVFSEILYAEAGHDFSKENERLSDKLTHLLYHLKESQKDIVGMLFGDSNEMFLDFFRRYLKKLFLMYKPRNIGNVPEKFSVNHYVAGFMEAVKWWIRRRMKETPEQIVDYYMTMIR